MRLIAAFLKLVRLPNLLFIALAQVLFQYCIYRPLYGNLVPPSDTSRFFLLVIASVLIAAAGYIINDYFDINIDEVNKPQRLVIDKFIHRRWAIAWHFILSTAGLLITILALPFMQKWYLVLANAGCIALLWLYSTNFKKSLLLGNIVISILTAWTILIIFFSKFTLADAIGSNGPVHTRFFRLAFLYAGFAFLISLIREAIKDMEDIPGDSKYGGRTMPIAWGLNAAKVYTGVLIIVLIALLVLIQVYILQFKWWWTIIYSIFLVIIPLVYLLFGLKASKSPADFSRLSSLTKFVMLTGIVSMSFFYFYI
jgi:4-hydroxybenzoate polyprenyltransferase